MKIFNSIQNYLLTAKVGDRILFGGTGLLDGLKKEDKNSTYRVVKVKGLLSNQDLVVREFRGKTNLVTTKDQQIGLLTKEEYNKLLVLW